MNRLKSAVLAAMSLAVGMGCVSGRAAQSPACGQLRLHPVSHADELVETAAILTKARMNLAAISAEHYCRVQGTYPQSLTALIEYDQARRIHEPCRVERELAHDGWGTLLRFGAVNGTPTLSSAGPDSVPGSADDLIQPVRGSPDGQPFDTAVLCSTP